MKNLFFLILIFCLYNGPLSAQDFYYIQTNGELPAGYDINKINDSDNVKKVLTPKTNDILSQTQSLPFPFLYNGSYYAIYKVSDNGYMTFNTGNTISHKPDSNYTNRQDLKNAIFPFWYDFEVKKLPYPNHNFTVKVISYTSGVSPDRTHTIQFYGLTKASDTLNPFITNSNVFAFAIVLYEGNAGRFDFVFNYFGKNDIDGLSGCSDNANNVTLLKNKPIPYPVAISSAVSNTIVYHFFPGISPTRKLYLKENIIEPRYKINEPVAVKSKISNLGADTVFAFNYYYIINQADTIVDSINLKVSNQYLLPKGENTILLTHSIPWQTGQAGSVNTIRTLVLLYEDSLNKDTFSNSKKSIALRILGLKPIPRNVMMEISTGGWCGYCTNSHVIAEDLKSLMGYRLIPVMHHFGDPMETTESNRINQTYEKGYPYGIIDRKFFSGQSSGWQNIVNIQHLDSSAAKIKIINKQFDAASRKISFTLNIRFFDYLLGNYRIGAIITEDNVRGNASPSQWSQNNYYSKEYGATDSTNPLYKELRYMDGYFHQYVVLDFPYGAWGKDSSLPAYIQPNDEFNVNLSYTLPPTTTVEYTQENNTKYCSTKDNEGQNEGMYKPMDINLIGFVAEYDEDIYKRIIINAASNKLLFDNSVESVFTNKGLTIFPNPANETISILNPFDNRSHCTIALFNALGKQVFGKDGSITEDTFKLDISGLSGGMYFIRIYNADHAYTEKLNVVK